MATMKLKDLEKGDRFEVTLKGTYVRPNGYDSRYIICWDGNGAKTGENYESYFKGDLEVALIAAPPAVGDQLIGADISYTLEAIVNGWWVVSVIDGNPLNCPMSYKSDMFGAFTRVPAKNKVI